MSDIIDRYRVDLLSVTCDIEAELEAVIARYWIVTLHELSFFADEVLMPLGVSRKVDLLAKCMARMGHTDAYPGLVQDLRHIMALRNALVHQHRGLSYGPTEVVITFGRTDREFRLTDDSLRKDVSTAHRLFEELKELFARLRAGALSIRGWGPIDEVAEYQRVNVFPPLPAVASDPSDP
jgi:hypothetical protein